MAKHALSLCKISTTIPFTLVQRLETVRRDFVANASHELKTPLTAISGYAETLLADDAGPDITRKFLVAAEDCRRSSRPLDVCVP